MTEPTMGRHNCDGPSSGNRRVINESYQTRPDLAGVFFKIRPFKPPNPSFHPIHSLFLPLPSLFNFHILPLDHCSPKILQSPKSVNLLVGVAAVGVCLATEYLSSFFSISKVCVSNFYSFILHYVVSFIQFYLT